jgi:hypothetical protein
MSSLAFFESRQPPSKAAESGSSVGCATLARPEGPHAAFVKIVTRLTALT